MAMPCQVVQNIHKSSWRWLWRAMGGPYCCLGELRRAREVFLPSGFSCVLNKGRVLSLLLWCFCFLFELGTSLAVQIANEVLSATPWSCTLWTGEEWSLRARDPSTKGTKDAKKRKRLELKGVNSVLPQQSSAGWKTWHFLYNLHL